MLSHHLDNTADYLKTLGQHSQLIAQLYHQGTTVNAQDMDNPRLMNLLIQQRILVPDTQSDYRLNPHLSKHLDAVFQHKRAYAVGANFADKIESLTLIAQEYKFAYQEGRDDDADNYAQDFDRSLFELVINIDEELLHLRTLVENKFSHLSNLQEKQRHNQFYIDRSQKLSAALVLLQQGDLNQQLQQFELANLQEVFKRHIGQRINDWHIQHLSIIDILKTYLFKLREVAPQAKKIRNLSLFLTKNPSYQVPDLSELDNAPSWIQRFAGFDLQSYANLNQTSMCEQLADVASRIPAAKVVLQQKQQQGALTLDEPLAIVELKPSMSQLALQGFWQQALKSHQPQSALRWKHQQIDLKELNDSVWLMVLLHSLQVDKSQKNHPLQQLKTQRCERTANHLWAGNIIVEDILAWKNS